MGQRLLGRVWKLVDKATDRAEGDMSLLSSVDTFRKVLILPNPPTPSSTTFLPLSVSPSLPLFIPTFLQSIATAEILHRYAVNGDQGVVPPEDATVRRA